MTLPDSAVSIVKCDETSNSVARAVELCNGLKGLKPSDKVLLKPNIVWGGGATKKLPKYGLITTARIIEDIVKLLRQYGCTNVALGEGSIYDKELGSDTMKGYHWSGMARVAKEYGVTLIDFNKSSYVDTELDGVKVQLARSALESDFLINVPVLKTHGQCKVSLGMKNLKGCLSMSSKRAFHRKDLHRMIALLNTKIKPKLTIIDGLYAMEHGPSALGRAHRMNLLIAGTDGLSCDMAGSAVLGIDPASVDHLSCYAGMHGRKLDPSLLQIQGEKISNVSKNLEWSYPLEEILLKTGVKGISIPFPGTRFCTQCVTHTEGVLSAFCKDNAGMSFDDVEICVGGEARARQDSKKVFLFGECSIRANKDREGAIKIKGCPPKATDMLVALNFNMLNRGRATKIMLERTLKTIGYKLGIYDEEYPTFLKYAPPAFDKNHFV